MCPSALFLSALLIFACINADSTEEQAFTNFYPPSTVDFHDIYTNSLALLSEDPSITPTIKQDGFHISNMPTQYVEFRQSRSTTEISTTTAEISVSESAENITDSSTLPTTLSSTLTTTTEDSEDSSVKVLPIKKNYQRGVLDLLFPAARVRTFKNIFDTFRRILSHTFRR